MAWIIPKDDLTLAKRDQRRQEAAEAVIERWCQSMSRDRSECTVRELQMILDIPLIVLDQWLTAPLAAVGTPYSVFQAVASPTIAQTKTVVFYGIGIETIPIPVSRLEFRKGGIAGLTQAQFELERLATCDTPEGYFSQPVLWDGNTQMSIQVLCRIATGAVCRLQLWNWVAEQAQTTTV